MTVEVRLLRYKFRFRNLTWREELHLTIPPGKNPTRIVLAHALEDVSGLPVKSVEEAAKVFAAMPIPVVSRVYRIYKGLLPASRRFETAGLYRAPDPSVYVKRVAEDDDVVTRHLTESCRGWSRISVNRNWQRRQTLIVRF